MRVYTVHERGGWSRDPDVVLVKEGFCWPALFVAALWGLYHRLWLGVIVYLALALGLSAALYILGVDQITEGAAGLAFDLLVAFEANDWRRRSLARRGYRLVAIAAGETLEDAESSFFASRPRSSGPAYDPAGHAFFPLSS